MPQHVLPVTVFAQVHYPDVWRDIKTVLDERLSLPFRLVVTTSHPASAIELPLSPHLVDIVILGVENRGRDILPFLKALAEAPDFEIGLKLHTKKSPQRADGSRWLAELLDSLLPAASTGAVVESMRADPRIGFVTPPGFCLPVRPWVLQNAGSMARVMEAMGHQLADADIDDAYFAAGSMFWFRRDALSQLADPAVFSLFEAEEGQLDGTVAHGVERLFAVETRRQGLLTVAMPALLTSGRETAASEIIAATKRHSEEPNFLFPAPYVSPESAAFAPAPDRKAQVIRLFAPAWRALPRRLRDWLRPLLKR